MDALIGSSGFVGSTLAGQHVFPASFNSSTMPSAAGRHFATAACAAAPGSMFEANRFPERDAARIDGLMAQLATIKVDRFVLISTIAVLASFDAGDDESTTAFQTSLAYGRNRSRLEDFCADSFTNCLVVRLPALFGPGLKKNFVFDILNPMPSMLDSGNLATLESKLPVTLAHGIRAIYRHDPAIDMFVIDRDALDETGLRADYEAAVTEAGRSAIGFTNPESQFQYYDMARLWSDIGLALAEGLSVLHLAPAPVSAAAVHERLTGRPMAANGARVHREDMHTAHAALFGRNGPYIADAADVLDRLADFAASQSKMRAGVSA